MQFAVAMKERLGHNTSSPGFTPPAISAKWSAVVQEDTATAYCAPTYAAKRFSNSPTFGPWLTQPLRSASSTAFSSAGPNDGRATGTVLVSVSATLHSNR